MGDVDTAKEGQKVSLKLIKHQALAAQVRNYLHLLQEAMKHLSSQSWQSYQAAKATASLYRNDFLEKRAQMCKNKGNLDSAHKIRKIKLRKPMEDSCQEIQAMLKPKRNTGILHIKFQEPENPSEIWKILEPYQMQEVMHKISFSPRFSTHHLYRLY